MLLLIFGLWLDLLPTVGQGRSLPDYLQSLILPATTLSLILIGITTRMVRSSMLEVLNRDYVRTARAKGVPNSRVIFGHAFPNALIPVLTVFAGQLAGLAGWGGGDRADLQLAGDRRGAGQMGSSIAITWWSRA